MLQLEILHATTKTQHCHRKIFFLVYKLKFIKLKRGSSSPKMNKPEGSLETKEMATDSSILAWRISWTEEPGGL